MLLDLIRSKHNFKKRKFIFQPSFHKVIFIKKSLFIKKAVATALTFTPNNVPTETGSLNIVTGHTQTISNTNGDIYLILLETAYETGESFMATSSVVVNADK